MTLIITDENYGQVETADYDRPHKIIQLSILRCTNLTNKNNSQLFPHPVSSQHWQPDDQISAKRQPHTARPPRVDEAPIASDDARRGAPAQQARRKRFGKIFLKSEIFASDKRRLASRVPNPCERSIGAGAPKR